LPMLGLKIDVDTYWGMKKRRAFSSANLKNNFNFKRNVSSSASVLIIPAGRHCS